MNQKMEEDAPYELYRRVWGDQREDEEITEALILSKAKEIIENFNEENHDLHEKIIGIRGKEAQKLAIKLKRDIEQFIKKYDILHLSPLQRMKKDAPYELKERVLERVGFGEKLSPEFVLSQAIEMIQEFYKKGNDYYEDLSGENGEEAQNMAEELKTNLEKFIRKYDADKLPLFVPSMDETRFNAVLARTQTHQHHIYP